MITSPSYTKTFISPSVRKMEWERITFYKKAIQKIRQSFTAEEYQTIKGSMSNFCKKSGHSVEELRKKSALIEGNFVEMANLYLFCRRALRSAISYDKTGQKIELYIKCFSDLDTLKSFVDSYNTSISQKPYYHIMIKKIQLPYEEEINDFIDFVLAKSDIITIEREDIDNSFEELRKQFNSINKDEVDTF